MILLWIINIALPEVCKLMNEKPLPLGGWLINSANALSNQEAISLTVAFPKNDSNKIEFYQGEKINYYTFSPVKDKDMVSNKCNKQFEDILKIVNPDIVHIFGTEMPHALHMVNTCTKMNIKMIISIQGLVSFIARHYMAYLPERIQQRTTFRDFVKRDNLRKQQKKFTSRGNFEKEAIQKVQHVIGRTTWDKACTTQINPNLKYHFCNETLREEFYNHEWSLEKCERYSIFVSQAYYPIKGLHFMLEAMPLILIRFPNAKLYISGPDNTKSSTLKEKIKLSSYDKYILELIRKFNLMDKVIFTGFLDETKMCERYLKSNVFACTSSIENSPNSLGEAMILGVPCVASDVGGVSDMLKHKEEGFVYQADASYMLAYYICEIFENTELTLKVSKNARVHALITHDKKENLNRHMFIYNEVNSNK